MREPRTTTDRAELLADVAEMYFLDGLTQADIAGKVGVTRSMVSRMLTEARHQGIVEIHIRRPLQFDRDLGEALIEGFGLKDAQVLVSSAQGQAENLGRLGAAGAMILSRYLRPGLKLGLAWGTAIHATVSALEVKDPIPSIKIVQFLGALGARIEDYDGHALVRRLETKLGGEGYYINAPFLVDSRKTALDLFNNKSIAETLALAKQCEVGLLGIGSIEKEYSSFYRAGYVSLKELRALQAENAVGDVCGHHFDARGRSTCADFCGRLVGISEKALLGIPVRIGVAGGTGKVVPVLGALRGGYINVLVTDSLVAKALLNTAKAASAR